MQFGAIGALHLVVDVDWVKDDFGSFSQISRFIDFQPTTLDPGFDRHGASLASSRMANNHQPATALTLDVCGTIRAMQTTPARLVGTATVAMMIGFIGGQLSSTRTAAQTPTAGPRPAYLVVSSTPVAPEKMGPYQQAAGPLAMAAGLEIVGRGDPRAHVLEGQWTLGSSLAIEKFRSMDDLLRFWNSPAYAEAKKLRAGLSKIDFIVAIEGR